jgi:hypothetical protein
LLLLLLCGGDRLPAARGGRSIRLVIRSFVPGDALAAHRQAVEHVVDAVDLGSDLGSRAALLARANVAGERDALAGDARIEVEWAQAASFHQRRLDTRRQRGVCDALLDAAAPVGRRRRIGFSRRPGGGGAGGGRTASSGGRRGGLAVGRSVAFRRAAGSQASNDRAQKQRCKRKSVGRGHGVCVWREGAFRACRTRNPSGNDLRTGFRRSLPDASDPA